MNPLNWDKDGGSRTSQEAVVILNKLEESRTTPRSLACTAGRMQAPFTDMGEDQERSKPCGEGRVRSSILEIFGMKCLIDIHIEKSNKHITVVQGRINQLGFKKQNQQKKSRLKFSLQHKIGFSLENHLHFSIQKYQKDCEFEVPVYVCYKNNYGPKKLPRRLIGNESSIYHFPQKY